MAQYKRSGKNVLEAARERISYVFDEFESIVVSISGGKDSTVLAHLALVEAKRRNRKITLFFLDEEAVYQATIEQVEYLMDLFPENTERSWLQIPFCLTNAVDLGGSGQLMCWDSKARSKWMHKRHSYNTLRAPWSHETLAKKRLSKTQTCLGFYSVLYNYELAHANTAFFVGLRADESIHRRSAVENRPGYKNVFWSTKRLKNTYSFYPIYDWQVSDIWKYIGENNIRYHKYYDFAFLKGVNPCAMRVSSLVHEKSFYAIEDLPAFEFRTYEKLLERCKGISFAQETAKNKTMFACQKLPKTYKSWREYRDFLLQTCPDKERKALFEKRFANHLENDFVARQQVRQLILNDYENNLPIENMEGPKKQNIKRWMDML